MQLCWSLDTIGPICRSADDCGLVFAAIHGADPRDTSSVDRKYLWPSSRDIATIRVGYDPEYDKDEHREALRVLRQLGVKLVPIRNTKLLDDYGLTFELIEAVVAMESAASFDELTRRGEPKGVHGWPRYWTYGQFMSAVDYLKFSRLRAILMERCEKLMRAIDIYLGSELMLYTNLAGYPLVAFPKSSKKTKASSCLDRNSWQAALTTRARCWHSRTLINGRLASRNDRRLRNSWPRRMRFSRTKNSRTRINSIPTNRESSSASPNELSTVWNSPLHCGVTVYEQPD